MQNLTSAVVIGNFIITLCVLIGCSLAIRTSRHQTTRDIQAQAIDALKAELDALQQRLTHLEKDNTRLQQTMSLIKSALRKRNMAISIDGDLVTITDTTNNTSQTGRIQENITCPPSASIVK
jgi:prefoldin subunit 5